MHQPKVEFNKKIHQPKLDVQQRIKNSPIERERKSTHFFFFLRGNTSNFIKKIQQCHPGQQNVWVVEHPPSTPKNLKYKEHVLLIYAQPYYPLSLHDSKVID